MAHVTFLGLGLMGTALARTALEAGRDTVVWNRTASRADALLADGAATRATAVEAIADSPVIVVCVDDHAATDSFLKDPAAEAALRDRTLVQLSTGSPRSARAAHEWARSIDARYLDGAILGYPSSIGAGETAILVAGDERGFETAEPILRILAPATTYLGSDAGLAAVLDEALLAGALGAIVGTVNGAALCEAGGMPFDQYLGWVTALGPTLVAIVDETAQRIANTRFEDTEASLRTWGATLDYMAESAADAGYSDEIPRFFQSLFDRAVAQGLGEQDVAALIQVIRPQAE